MVAKIIDGRAIAKECRLGLKKTLAGHAVPRLTIIVVGHNPVIETYVGAKVSAAKKIGIDAMVDRLPDTIQEGELIAHIESVVGKTNGIIVQLPLPKHINRETVLNTIPASHDVDVLTDRAYELFTQGNLPCTPPVASAALKALTNIKFPIKNARVAIIGNGKLVGMPCDVLLTRLGAIVTVINRSTSPENRKEILQKSDLVISGIGVPNSLQVDDIKDGAVLLDAGTSERDGGTSGDIDANCIEKAQYIAAVPGGIGPLTVVSLFENLVILTENQSK